MYSKRTLTQKFFNQNTVFIARRVLIGNFTTTSSITVLTSFMTLSLLSSAQSIYVLLESNYTCLDEFFRFVRKLGQRVDNFIGRVMFWCPSVVTVDLCSHSM